MLILVAEEEASEEAELESERGRWRATLHGH